jgi:prepilin-type N-terminal cleavage/methylation domain-containing protein
VTRLVSLSRRGVTILEVILAIAILAIGVLALAGLQTSSLRSNRQAQTINQLTRLASSEMELRRQTVAATGTSTCITTVPLGFNQADCTVEVVPCGIIFAENASEFLCDGSATFATYRLTVQAAGRDQTVTLQSLYSGFYVSGTVSGATGGGGSP